MFLKEVSHALPGYVLSNSNVVENYYNLKRLFSIVLYFFVMSLIPVMTKLNF